MMRRRTIAISLLLWAQAACGSGPTPQPERTPDTESSARPEASDGPADIASVTPSDAAPARPLADRLSAQTGDALLSAVEAAEVGALEATLPDLPPSSAPRAVVALRLGRLAAHRRDYAAAKALLNSALDPADGPAAALAQQTLDRIAARQTVAPGRVGVLLPLSGPYAPIGKSALAAIKLALDGVDGVELAIADTAGDAERAPAEVERLVHERHVAAIIGPVGSIESHAAARAAERLEVPLMALSARADLTRLGTFIFRHRLTRRAQATAIARFAVETLGLRTFGILYPKTDYGQEMMRAFWQTVVKLGGEVRGAQGYSVNVSDFNEPIKKLVGRYHLEARKPDGHWQRLNRKSRDKALHVPPVVDFEALFIPDGGRRVRLMLPFLAYWDIEVKNDPQLSPLQFAPKYGGDTPQLVQILGGSGFTDPRLTRNPPLQAFNSVFVDAFWPESDAARTFVEMWTAAYQRAPAALAAHAFDAAHLVAGAVVGRSDRDAVRRALLATPVYGGVFGPTRVGSDGEVEFELQVLTLDPAMGVVPLEAPSSDDREGYFDEDAPRN